VFDEVDGRWQFRLCQDGNANGLRRAEITSGVDGCDPGAIDLTAMFSGVSIAVDPSLPAPEGGAGSADPVRFGVSDMASFSPEGSGSAGTLYVRSQRGQQFAIRVSSTGRTRILRYDPGADAWRPS
jgi:hypothetical protein